MNSDKTSRLVLIDDNCSFIILNAQCSGVIGVFGLRCVVGSLCSYPRLSTDACDFCQYNEIKRCFGQCIFKCVIIINGLFILSFSVFYAFKMLICYDIVIFVLFTVHNHLGFPDFGL